MIAQPGYAPSSDYFYSEIYLNSDRVPTYDDYGTITHEMGHAFGLAHTNDTGSVMHPYDSGRAYDTPQAPDVETINYLY